MIEQSATKAIDKIENLLWSRFMFGLSLFFIDVNDGSTSVFGIDIKIDLLRIIGPLLIIFITFAVVSLAYKLKRLLLLDIKNSRSILINYPFSDFLRLRPQIDVQFSMDFLFWLLLTLIRDIVPVFATVFLLNNLFHDQSNGLVNISFVLLELYFIVRYWMIIDKGIYTKIMEKRVKI